MSLSEHAARLIGVARASDEDTTESAGWQLYELIFGSLPGDAEVVGLLAGLAISPDDGRSLEALAAQVDDALADDPAAQTAAFGLVTGLYRRQAEGGRAAALLDLGDLLEFEDDDAAQAAYEQAVAAGEIRALVELAYVLRRKGDDAGAEAAARRAGASGDPDVVPHGLITLALVLPPRDRAAAKAALYQAIETGHPQWAPAAMRDLGDLLEHDGDHEAARTAFEQAIDASAGNQERVAEAAWSLASLEEQHGDAAAARAAWQRVFDTGHYHYAARAVEALLMYLRNDGDLDGVRALQQAAAAAGNHAAPEALVTIGDMLEERGDHEGSRAALQQAIDDGYAYPDDLLERLHPSPRPTEAELAGLPPQFNPQNMTRTGIEVLEHGLPALPAELSYLMAIPVAYWTAKQCAVVLFLRFRRHGRAHEPGHLQVTYQRAGGGWQPHPMFVGHGPVHDPIARPGDRREMDGSLMTEYGGSHVDEVTPGHPAVVMAGRVAPPITHLALVQDGRTDKRRLDSHFGAWVICTQSQSPFHVQGLDQDGNLLAAISHPFRPPQ